MNLLKCFLKIDLKTLDIYMKNTYISGVIKINYFFEKNSAFSNFLDIYPYEKDKGNENVQFEFT